MEESLKIDVKRHGDCETALFRGTIDAHAEARFDDLFDTLSTCSLTMDFSQTGRINSMGIALLLRSIKRIKNDKKAEVSVCGLNQINAMLFKMTGIFMLAPEIKPARASQSGAASVR